MAAYKQVDMPSRTKLLELAADGDGPVVILPLLATDVAHVADYAIRLHDDRAQAVAETGKHSAMLGTYDRAAYAHVIDDYDILDL